MIYTVSRYSKCLALAVYVTSLLLPMKQSKRYITILEIIFAWNTLITVGTGRNIHPRTTRNNELFEAVSICKA
jgi:hypothetical protein